MAKFKQHRGATPLIEDTYDPFWGAGAPITARRLRDGSWRGRNVFGQILDQVRTEMRRECAAFDQQKYIAANQQSPPAGTTHHANQNQNQNRTPRPAGAPPPPPTPTPRQQARPSSTGLNQSQPHVSSDYTSPIATVNYRRGKKSSYAPQPTTITTSHPYNLTATQSLSQQ